MSETIKAVGGGVSPNPVVKAVLEALGNVYIVEQGKTNDDIPIYFRVWSNGFKEQWQNKEAIGSFTFPVAFTTTDYVVIGPGFNMVNVAWQGVTKTTTGFSTSNSASNSSVNYWHACGY